MPIDDDISSRGIAADISRGIAGKMYPPGQELPMQQELAQTYGVDQSTVSRAITLLAARGLVLNRGRGHRTVVNPLANRLHLQLGADLSVYEDEVRSLGLEPRVDVAVRRVNPPVFVGDLLGLKGDGPMAIERILTLWAGDTLTQAARSYVRVEEFADTTVEDRNAEPRAMLELLATIGLGPLELAGSIVGRPAEPDEAKALGMSKEQHMYVIERVGRRSDGSVLEVTVLTMPQYLWAVEIRQGV